MKKYKNSFNFILIFLLLGVILLGIYKFRVYKENIGAFKIYGIHDVKITDLSGNHLSLSDLIDTEKGSYFLFFRLTNCYSCIYEGLEILKTLKNSGNSCVAVVIHDIVDEVNGWSVNHDFEPLFIISTEMYYKSIQSAVLPVLVKLKTGKVKSYQFITP